MSATFLALMAFECRPNFDTPGNISSYDESDEQSGSPLCNS